MTTLKGQELYDYLTVLRNKIAGQDHSQAHAYMQKILGAEKSFLEYQQKRGIEAQLAFSPNGLPTIESLKADLETICGMEEFKEIAQICASETDNDPKVAYTITTEKDWNKEKNNYKPEELNHKTTLTLQENNKGKLEITITDGIHTKGCDEHSQKHPILKKISRAAYQVNWNTLFTETQTNYLKINKTLTTKSGQGFAKISPKKMRRISQIEQKIGSYKSTLVYYDDPNDNWMTRELYTLAFLLELERNNASYFRWRRGWFPDVFYIYRQRFLDTKIATIVYNESCIYLHGQRYVDIAQKILPEFQKTNTHFCIHIE